MRHEATDRTKFRHEVVLMKTLDAIMKIMDLGRETDTVLVLGDFNMKTIKWVKRNRIMKASNFGRLLPYKKHFIDKLEEKGLKQINCVPNDRNIYLDLVFTNKPENCRVNKPTRSLLPENEPQHHKAIDIEFFCYCLMYLFASELFSVCLSTQYLPNPSS